MRKLIQRTIILLLIMSMMLGCVGCGKATASNADISKVDLNNVQGISYDAQKEYEKALEEYENGCEPATIIRDDTSMDTPTVALVFQGMPQATLTSQILTLLDQHKVNACFAVSAIEAAEDEDTLQLIQKKGYAIADAGLNGSEGMENYDADSLIYNFAHSKKVFNTLLNLDTKLMLLNRSMYTDNVCVSAKACGYDSLIAPSSGRYLNEKSFKSYEKTLEYIGNIKSGTILVVKTNGAIDATEFEPKTDSKKPAKDKQAGVAITGDNEEEDISLFMTVKWLLDALDEKEVDVCKISDMKALTNEEYVQMLFDEGNGAPAEVISGITTLDKVAGLVFTNVCGDEKKLDYILGRLEATEAKATFFVSSKDMEDYPEQVLKIAESGYSVGTTGTTGEAFSGKDKYEIYDELMLAKRDVQRKLNLKCKYYMPLNGYDDNVLVAASVVGLTVIDPGEPASYENIGAYSKDNEQNSDNTELIIDDSVDLVELAFGADSEGIKAGSINWYIADENMDTQSIVDFLTLADMEELEVLDMSELIKKANVAPEIDQAILDKLRETNEGKMDEGRKFIYTTEKAVALTFYGIANRPALNDVLSVMAEKGYRGTFFVTIDDIQHCSEQIRQIVAAGNEIGIAYIENTKYPAEFDSVAAYILTAQKNLRTKYGIDSKLIIQPYGEVKDETKEAISATGCKHISREFTMVQSAYVEETSVDSFYGKYADKIKIHRGSIAYFSINSFVADKEMDPDSKDETIVGNLFRKFISRNINSLICKDSAGNYISSTAYTCKSVGEISSSRMCYIPGKSANTAVANNKNVLTSMASEAEQNDYMISRYIGNISVTDIPGLSAADNKRVDKSGHITDDRVVFLSFDDWGNDAELNKLLYVLGKYNVKATFFVRTNNVQYNPNLLRAIAVEGHAVASHTNSHMMLSKRDESITDAYVYNSLTDEEAKKLRRDVVISYSTLNYYTGDVNVNGRKSLTTLFRSPTLAVSRIGMYQVFDTGFTYIVSGDFSTSDYAAGSVEELVNTLRNGKKEWNGLNTVANGSCLVMHMSPTAKYTADALDILIPEWQAQGYSFARIDDYLK